MLSKEDLFYKNYFFTVAAVYRQTFVQERLAILKFWPTFEKYCSIFKLRSQQQVTADIASLLRRYHYQYCNEWHKQNKKVISHNQFAYVYCMFASIIYILINMIPSCIITKTA